MDKKINKKKKTRVHIDESRFSRVSGIKYINSELFENCYQKQSNLGHKDDFAKLGWERLGRTQGKEFRK